MSRLVVVSNRVAPITEGEPTAGGLAAGVLDALKQQAKFAGLNDAQIEACLNDRGLEDAILNERLEETNTLQIEATPTFIFNQKPEDKIVSAAPYDDFKKKIDGLMK